MAALFNGTNTEFIQDNTASELEVGTNSFALMCWGKWTSAIDMCLVGKGAGIGIRFSSPFKWI